MRLKSGSRSGISFYWLNLWAVIFFCVCGFVVLSRNNSFCAEAGAYQVEFQGIKEKNLLKQIRDLSRTLEMSSKPAGSVGILRSRTKEDIELFTGFLKSEGYIDAEINETIDTNKSPWDVIFKFSLNSPFILSSVKVKFTPKGHEDAVPPDILKAGIVTGVAYRSKTILEGEEKLLFLIKKQGFPYPVMEKREVTADHRTRTVSVDYVINPGRKAFFGDTQFKGLEYTDHTFLMKFVPWKKGEVYSPDLLNKCYSEFMNLGLFSTVKITEGNILNDNILPMEIEVTERKRNSVSAGLRYHTDEGPGVKFSWENRDLFGRGEKLSFLSSLSSYITTVEGVFKKPAFFSKKQTLRISIQKSREDPDAYTSDSFSASVFIDRELAEKMDISGGLTFKASRIEQLESLNSFSLLSLPVHFSLDKSNDLLDPVKGGRLTIQLTPFYDPSGESLFYSKGLINYRHYLKILDNPLLVMAGNITLGMIKGASRFDIPADERFYAGGGGSVRGYPYQSLGPVSGTTPLGGKAKIEMSFEARLRMTQKIGFVVFMDGGTAYSEKLFDQGQDIRWGTGTGVRYFTPIGPLRFDVAVPLNKRAGIDDSFQLYISIGQAF